MRKTYKRSRKSLRRKSRRHSGAGALGSKLLPQSQNARVGLIITVSGLLGILIAKLSEHNTPPMGKVSAPPPRLTNAQQAELNKFSRARALLDRLAAGKPFSTANKKELDDLMGDLIEIAENNPTLLGDWIRKLVTLKNELESVNSNEEKNYSNANNTNSNNEE
jgi:hypothetical protein